MALTPPSKTKCQCVITPEHNFMKFGPRPEPKKCGKKPKYLIAETIPKEDGECGMMTVCPECKDKFILQNCSTLDAYIIAEILEPKV